MDLLEKYKETWKNQPDEADKVSKVDIYKMSHKKSTSVVKWIFIIGIIEFLFFFLLGFIPFESETETETHPIFMEWFYTIINVLGYIVSFYFIYQFYKNYKNISVVTDTKSLIESIIKTRKTVKNFIKIKLIIFFSFSITTLLYTSYYHSCSETEKPEETMIKGIMTFLILFLLIPIYYFMRFYYHLLYGWLLDKLYYNHKELSELEELK